MDDDDGRWMMMMEDERVKTAEKRTFLKVVGDAPGTIGGKVRMALQKFDSNEIYEKIIKNK